MPGACSCWQSRRLGCFGSRENTAAAVPGDCCLRTFTCRKAPAAPLQHQSNHRFFPCPKNSPKRVCCCLSSMKKPAQLITDDDCQMCFTGHSVTAWVGGGELLNFSHFLLSIAFSSGWYIQNGVFVSFKLALSFFVNSKNLNIPCFVFFSCLLVLDFHMKGRLPWRLLPMDVLS